MSPVARALGAAASPGPLRCLTPRHSPFTTVLLSNTYFSLVKGQLSHTLVWVCMDASFLFSFFCTGD